MHLLASIVICCLLLQTSIRCNNGPDKKTGKTNARDSTAARISRGDYLVNTVANCMHCHADRDFTKFAGPVIKGTEGKGGAEIEPGIFVKNITPFAIGDWTDDEVYRALTTGIRKNGDTLIPIMPFISYAKMPKEEIYSIIAYLRTLKPIEYKVPDRKVDPAAVPFWSTIYKTLYLDHTGEKMPLPSPDEKVKMGTYLVNAGNCKGCHTRFDMNTLDFDTNYLAGGSLFKDSALDIAVNTSNITPDTATGIGGWTEEMFLSKFKNYRDEKSYNYNPGKYNSFMPWIFFAQLTDNDLSAIYAYLRTVKPVKNKVEKWPQ